jgi:hypothetical protein
MIHSYVFCGLFTLRGKNILLNKKGKNCTINLSQAVNFKPVSLHEILSDRDKQRIISVEGHLTDKADS